jgi:hypothetical protein
MTARAFRISRNGSRVWIQTGLGTLVLTRPGYGFEQEASLVAAACGTGNLSVRLAKREDVLDVVLDPGLEPLHVRLARPDSRADDSLLQGALCRQRLVAACLLRIVCWQVFTLANQQHLRFAAGLELLVEAAQPIVEGTDVEDIPQAFVLLEQVLQQCTALAARTADLREFRLQFTENRDW